MAVTSTGGTETKERNSTQLQIFPRQLPWLICVMCTSAPEFGNIVESSANTNAMSRMAAAPIIQENTDIGPACLAASSATKSQPEPIMLPRLAYKRPMTPASRLNLVGPAMFSPDLKHCLTGHFPHFRGKNQIREVDRVSKRGITVPGLWQISDGSP